MNEDNTTYHGSDGGIPTPAEIDQLDKIESRLGNSDDISETSDAAWATAVRGKHALAAVRGAVPIRLDPDVQVWLRAEGPGFQTEINRMLRERMLAEGG